jgi:TP901 family phage tail tape measure protein
MPIQVPVTQTGLEASIQAAAQRAGRNLKIDLGVSSRSIGALSQPLGKITGQADQFTKSMEAANARVLAFGASVGVLSAVSQGFKEIITTTIQVEKSLANINSVLGANSEKLNKFKNDIFSVAKETGNSFQTVSEAALELSRQGLKSDEVLRRLKDSMILSRLSGLDAASAVEGLTAAVNSFSKEGATTSEVLNKISNTAAKFSVSERDLIEGFKRSASVAQQAGVSLDELGGIITAVQQKTARGGAVIGNAFKTIFTRIQRPDSLALLEQVGAATTDAQDKLLPATKLIENLAGKIKGLNDVEVANITEKIGGGFQVGPLIAALDDITGKTSTFKAATESMATAGSEAYQRNTALNQTLAASINTATVNLQELANTLGEIGVTDNLKNILSFFNSFATNVKDVLQGEGLGSDFARGLVKGIGNILSGPGLAIFGIIIAKLTIGFAKFGIDALKTFLNIGSAAKEMGAIQTSITSALLNNKSIQTQILALEGNRVAQAQFFSTALNTQLATMEKMRGISASIAPDVFMATTGSKKRKSGNAGGYIPSSAGGYMPTVMAEANDISKGVGGARPSDRPVVIPNFAFGGGKTGTMVAHTGEHIVPNYNGGSGSAIFNRDMVGRMGLPSGAQQIRSAGGFIPNFAASITDATTQKEFEYFYTQPRYKKNAEKDAREYKGTARGRAAEGAALKRTKIAEEKKSDTLFIDADANLGGIGVVSVEGSKGIVNGRLVGKGLEGSAKEFLDNTYGKDRYSSVEMSNIQVGSLKSLEGAIASKKQFRSKIQERFSSPLTQLASDILPKIFGREKTDAYSKYLLARKDDPALFSNSVIGGIFESAVKMSTTSVKNIPTFQNVNEFAPFDFEENEADNGEFKKAFGFSDLFRADAKQTASKKAINSVISKALRNPGTQGKMKAAQLGKGTAASASGYIPNFVDQKYVMETLGRIKSGTSGFSKQEQETFLKKFGATGGTGKGISLQQVFDTLDSDPSVSPFINKAYGAAGATASTSQVFKEFEKQIKANPTQLRNVVKGKGFIPNFANPLNEAISREIGAGVNPSQVYIDQNNSLKGPMNPSGLMVANRRDEPSGGWQGINRARKEGVNAKTYGAAQGFIPNFANDASDDKTNKSMGDTIGKLIILQTVATGLSGVFEGMGGKVSKFGDGLSSLSASIMSMAMLSSMSAEKMGIGASISKGYSSAARGDSSAVTKAVIKGSGAGMLGRLGAAAGSSSAIVGGVGKVAGLASGLGSLFGMFGKFLPVIGQAIFAFQGVNAVLKLFGVDTDKYIKQLGQSLGLIKTPAQEAADKLKELGKVDISNILEGNFGPQGPSALGEFLKEQNLTAQAKKAGVETKDKDIKELNKELLIKELQNFTFANNKELLVDRAYTNDYSGTKEQVSERLKKSFTEGESVYGRNVGMFQTKRAGSENKGVSDLQFQALSQLEASIASRYSSKEAQQKLKTAQDAGLSSQQLRPIIEELFQSGFKNIGEKEVAGIKEKITRAGNFTEEELNLEIFKELAELDKKREPAIAAANYQEKINLELAKLRLDSAIKLKMATLDFPTIQDASLSIEKELLTTTDARRISVEREIEARARGRELIKSQVESVKDLTLNSKELMDSLSANPTNQVLIDNWGKVKGIVEKYADTLMQTGDSTKAEASIRGDITDAVGDNIQAGEALQKIIQETLSSTENLFNIETKKLDVNRQINSIGEAYNYIIGLQNAKKQEGLDITLREIANAEKLNSINDRIFKARAEGLKSITSKDVGDKIDVLANQRERTSAISSSANERKKIFIELQKDLLKSATDKKLPENLKSNIYKAKNIDELKPVVAIIAKAEQDAAVAKLDAAFKENKIKLETAYNASDIAIAGAKEAAQSFLNVVAGFGGLNPNAINRGAPAPRTQLNELETQANIARNTLLSTEFSGELLNKFDLALDDTNNSIEQLGATLEELNPAYKDAKKALEDNFTKSLLTFENDLAKRESKNIGLETQKQIASAKLESKMKDPETYSGVFNQKDYLAKQQSLEMQKLRQEQDFQSKIDSNTAAIELERKLYTLENITAIKDNSQVIKDLIDQLKQSQPDAQPQPDGQSKSDASKSKEIISRDSANLSQTTINQIAKLVSAEVGGQGPEAQQALIETFFNRAKRDNKSIDQIVNSEAYYHPIQTGKINSVTPIPDAEIRRLIGLVESGSNISRGATDNASAGVAANAKKLYPNNNIDIGGETFYSKNIGSSNFANVGGMSSEIQKAVADIQKMNVEYSKIPDMAMKAAGNMNIQGEAQDRVAKIIQETVQQSALRNEKDKQAIVLAEELYQIRSKETNPKSFTSGFASGIRDLNTEKDNFSFELGERVPKLFADNMASAMEGVIMQGESLGDSLRSAATSFLNEITKANIRNISNTLTSGAQNLGSSILSSFTQRASGGPITGGSGMKDDVPALLMGGEFVMNKKSVSKYGMNFMNQLNNGGIMKYAKGGAVKEISDINQIGKQTIFSGKAGSDIIGQYEEGQTPRQMASGDGFMSSGMYGSGSIVGKHDLLAFATQSQTSGKNDIISNENKFSSVSLEPESARLTVSGRMDSPEWQSVQKDKEEAFNLYLQQLNQEKEFKEAESARRTAFRKAWQSALWSSVINAAMVGIAQPAIAGFNAGMGQASSQGVGGFKALNSGFSGMLNGGNIGGTQLGGIFNTDPQLRGIGNASQLASLYESDPNSQLGRLLASNANNYISNISTPRAIPVNRATGGLISNTAGVDTVPAMLSGGEFVMNRAATQNIGAGNLQSLNTGSSSNSLGQDSGANTDKIVSKLDELITAIKDNFNGNISVNVGSGDSSQKEGTASNGQQDNSQANAGLAKKIKAVVMDVIQQEKRLGGSLRFAT